MQINIFRIGDIEFDFAQSILFRLSIWRKVSLPLFSTFDMQRVDWLAVLRHHEPGL